MREGGGVVKNTELQDLRNAQKKPCRKLKVFIKGGPVALWSVPIFPGELRVCSCTSAHNIVSLSSVVPHGVVQRHIKLITSLFQVNGYQHCMIIVLFIVSYFILLPSLMMSYKSIICFKNKLQ